MSVGLQHYLILAVALFSVGVFGALAKRNAVAILMAIELMLNAVNVMLVAFSRYVVPLALTGQIFALFVITVAAAEAAVGLAIIIAIYRNRRTVDVEEVDIMKW